MVKKEEETDDPPMRTNPRKRPPQTGFDPSLLPNRKRNRVHGVDDGDDEVEFVGTSVPRHKRGPGPDDELFIID